MTKINILIIVIFFSFLLGLSPVKVSAADVLSIQQTDTSLSCNHNAGSGWQSFTATQNNVSKIVLKAGTDYSGAGSVATTTIYDLTNGYNIATTTFAAITRTDNSDMEYVFSPPIPLTVGHQYKFEIVSTPWSARCSCNGCNPYAGGEWVFNNTIDLYFRIYYSDTYVPPSTFQINLITPFPTPPFAIYETMPQQYNFTYENPLNWYPQIRFMVKRQEDEKAHGWPDYVNSSTYWTIPAASSTLITASSSFQLPDGVYDLRVDFWANTPELTGVATTTFTVHTGGTYGGYSFATNTADKLLKPTPMTEEEICPGIATSTLIGSIECGLKKALYGVGILLFSPSFDTVQNFKNSYDLFKGCFPFNAFFQITDMLTEVASSTEVATSSALTVPFINVEGEVYDIPVVATHTLPDLIGQENFDILCNTLIYIIWAMAAVIVSLIVIFI